MERDGIIVFSVDNTTGLRQVSAGGGECSILTKPDPSRAEVFHYFLIFFLTVDIICIPGTAPSPGTAGCTECS